MIAPRSSSRDLSLRDFVRSVKRRKWIFLGSVLFFGLAGAAACFLVPPQFRSEAMVRIEGNVGKVFQSNPSDPVEQATLPNQNLDVPTQAQVMQSYQILSQAFQVAGIVLPPPGSDVPQPDIRVIPVPETNVIMLRVTADSEDAAQKLANEIPAAYVNYVQGQRQEQFQKAANALEATLDSKKKQLQAAENDLDRFQQARPIIALENEAQELAARLTRAEVEVRSNQETVKGNEERLENLKADRAKEKMMISVPSRQANTARLQQQQQQIDLLVAQRNQALVTWSPKSPQVREVDVQLAVQRKALADIPSEISVAEKVRNPRIVQLDTDVSQANAALEASKASLVEAQAWRDDAQKSLKTLGQTLPALNAKRRGVLLLTDSVSIYQKQADALNARSTTAVPPATVIMPASLSQQVAPRPALYVALALLVGVVCGSLGVLYRERATDTITDNQELAAALDDPNIPALPVVAVTGKTPVRAGGDARAGRYSEIFTSLRLLAGDEGFKTLLITGARARQGRARFVYGLGKAMAAAGHRTLLIDANADAPGLNRVADAAPSPGLAEALLDPASVLSFVQPDKAPNLHLMTVGSVASNSFGPIIHDRMGGLIEALSADYDYIVIVGSGLREAPEALDLAKSSDACVFLAQLKSTTKPELSYCLQVLDRVGARVLCVEAEDEKA